MPKKTITKKVAKKKTPKVGAADAISIFLTVNSTEYTSTADTLEEALNNIPQVRPFTKAIFTIRRGDKQSKPIVLTIPHFNRLFYPGMTGQVQRAQFVKRYLMLV